MKRLQGTDAGQHSFAEIPGPTVPRSAFNRSCGLKTTLDSGDLVPIFVDEMVPGDTIALRATLFARLATLLHPIMDNIYMDVFFFAVPYRLVWDNWEKFNGSQVDPGDSTDYEIPIMTSPVGGYAAQSLSDYLGIPTKVPGLEHSSLWHRAYSLIWNEYFRSEDLQDSAQVDTDDGPDLDTDYPLRKRGKRHDYFTSCLPWAQKGAAVQMSLGSTAPLQTTGDGQPTWSVGAVDSKLYGVASQASTEWATVPTGTGFAAWDDPKLEVDLATATAGTINELREAFQFQKLLERDARGGTRYVEMIKAHFGISNAGGDARFQRPEYLGGGTTPVILKQVEQTSAGTGDLGDLAGYGIAADESQGFSYNATEHVLILGMVSARADLNYQQGLPRMFSRKSRFDFFLPALSHIGEQAVLNKEIYAQGSDDPTADAATFGYQERWAEMRYKPSQVTGIMRSNYSFGTLDPWHLAIDFAALPTLGSTFIEEAPPIQRVVAVTGEPEFLLDAYFTFKHVRPMPTYSVPGLIDHF